MNFIKRVIRTISFIARYLNSLVIANVRIAADVLTPGLQIKPGIIVIRLETQTDLEILVFTNLLMMTPGTIGLEISKDRRFMYVHAMYLGDLEKARRELEVELQQQTLEVLR